MGILFIICGSRLFPQTNDSTYYKAQGWQYRISLIKMLQADNFKAERDSLLSLNNLFINRINTCNKQLTVKDNKIYSLNELIKLYNNKFKINDNMNKAIIKNNKKKIRKVLIIGIPISFTLGMLTILILR